MSRKKLVSILSCLLAAGSNPRTYAAGADPMQFLFMDSNARTVGMGSAYAAAATDANALWYNPAGLGRVERYEATFMHNEHVQGISQEFMGFAAPQGWGLALNYVDLGKIPRTTMSSPEAGTSSFGASNLAFSIGYGRRFWEQVSLGAGVKLIRESIDDVSAQGHALDLGGMFDIPPVPGLRFAIALQNLGPAVRFQQSKENLPLTTRVGAAYGFSAMGSPTILTLDVTKERNEGLLAAFGAEFVIAGIMPLRMGFNTRNDAGPGVAMGIGWLHRDLSIDYGFVPYGDLGGAHRFSFGIRFGSAGRVSAVAAPPAALSAGLKNSAARTSLTARKLIRLPASAWSRVVWLLDGAVTPELHARDLASLIENDEDERLLAGLRQLNRSPLGRKLAAWAVQDGITAGLAPAGDMGNNLGDFDVTSSRVRIRNDLTDEAETARVLAHEFVHALIHRGDSHPCGVEEEFAATLLDIRAFGEVQLSKITDDIATAQRERRLSDISALAQQGLLELSRLSHEGRVQFVAQAWDLNPDACMEMSRLYDTLAKLRAMTLEVEPGDPSAIQQLRATRRKARIRRGWKNLLSLIERRNQAFVAEKKNVLEGLTSRLGGSRPLAHRPTAYGLPVPR